MEGSEEELGPIDVLVIGYHADARMAGDAVPIVLDLAERGIIRVLDARFVRKSEDGTFSGFDLADLDVDAAGDLTAFAGASTGMVDDDDVALVAGELDPGDAAVILVYENRWAAGFVAAVRRSGGFLITNQRIGVQELMDALDAADADASHKG
jgi:hypothetical protein